VRSYDITQAVEVLISPGDDEQFTAPYTLGGVEVLLEFAWAPRLSSWRLITRAPNGDVIASSRISPGATLWPDITDPRLPRGLLYAVGVDPYRRDELGSAVRIGFIPEVA
jgi:hypothetical protein